ncbi:MAG: UbiD family decarboxylase [Xanthomonadales bacterium]|nr:UbiD family decarboxylase [Xanthomonadales bacterium]
MRDYLAKLRARGEVTVVEVPVDPQFELAAVTQGLQQRSDKVIVFNHVIGSKMPVVTNIFGSRRRLCEIIGAEDGNFCRRWMEFDPSMHGAGSFAEAREYPRISGKLSDLPQITYFEKDGGPYITSALFLAKHPKTGIANLSFHRSQFIADDELRIRLGSTHDLTQYHKAAEAEGKALPAVLLIGTAPEIFVSACASLPMEEDELKVAAAIRGAPLPMQRCRTIDLEFPADTEVVVEGHILPNELRPEGPFGEFMGYYVPVGNNHVFEVLDVHWREDAVFHSLNCGSPEDMNPLDFAISTRIYRRLVEQLPGIVNVACYPNLMNTVIQIRQQYEGHARKVLLAAIAAHLDYSKSCMVVDEDVDLYNLNDVWWAYLTRGRADTRAFILEDMPGFYRDPHKDHWGRLAIDATKPWGREAEFERKRIPGADTLDLGKYIGEVGK